MKNTYWMVSFLMVAALGAQSQAGFTTDRTVLENYRDNYGGIFEDFTATQFADRFLDDELAASGVTFASSETILGDPITVPGTSVYISSSPDGRLNDSIAGRPSSTSFSEDGRVAYDIRFTTPVRYAGVERNWNPPDANGFGAWTEFYDAGGNLLIRSQVGAFPEFHAWVADSDNISTWVSYIKAGGDFPYFPNTMIPATNQRQVGYTDDLFFGTAIPEPATLLYLMSGAGALGFMRLRRRMKEQRDS